MNTCRRCARTYAGSGRYCSNMCRHNYIKCPYCKKAFTKRGGKRYCSQICANRQKAEDREWNLSGRVTKLCPVCGVEHVKNSSACSKTCTQLIKYAQQSPIRQAVKTVGGRFDRCANWACRKRLGEEDYKDAYCSKGCFNFTKYTYLSCDICGFIAMSKRKERAMRKVCKIHGYARDEENIPNKPIFLYRWDISRPTAIISNLLWFLDDQKITANFNDLGVIALVERDWNIYRFNLTTQKRHLVDPYKTFCIQNGIVAACNKHNVLVKNTDVIRKNNNVSIQVTI